MQLLKGVEAVDLAIKIGKTIILSDFHIGYEEALNKQGVYIPRFQFEDIIKRLTKILEKTKPSTIIINGDLKHEFGTISRTEWDHTLKLLTLLEKHAKKIILIRGNHDKVLKPIADKKKIEIKTHHIIKDIYITHGDIIPKTIPKKCKTIIIGHEHPAINISSGIRTEKYKCFLLGKYKTRNLIVQPSFNLVTEGTDIIKEKLLSPFLHQKLSNFDIFIVGDKVYHFGKLKNIQQTL